MTGEQKPELRVAVFTDYICPFCYIGDARLDHLRERYLLKVNWCFLEIHPDTPAEGMPVTDLHYSDEQFRKMMQGFYDMAAEEGLKVSKRRFTTSSHHALLLAEAAKQEGADVFYRLHRGLFEAYFGAGRNIGDQDVLRDLAAACGVSVATVDSAWSEPRFATRLDHNMAAARELSVTGTPTYFFTERPLSGAVSTDRLFAAAEEGLVAQREQRTSGQPSP